MSQEESVERFVSGFVLPLCKGAEVEVRAPLGQVGLERLLQKNQDGELDRSEAGQELSRQRVRIAGEIVLSPTNLTLKDDPGALYLLCAFHDLLFVQHPAAQRPTLSGRRRVVETLCNHVLSVCKRAVPQTPAAPMGKAAARNFAALCAARHSLLWGFFSLVRNDVIVTYWAGRQEFQGMDPPARLLLWSNVRRVRQERLKVRWHSAMSAEGEPMVSALRALLMASPLTDLFTPRRVHTPFSVRGYGAVLRTPSLLRALVNRYLELGFKEVGAPLSHSLLSLLAACERAEASPDEARLFLCLIAHLHLLVALQNGEPEVNLELSGPADSGLRDFYGLYGALAGSFSGFAWPRDIPDRSKERADKYGESCRRVVSKARLDELIGIIGRFLAKSPSTSANHKGNPA